MSLRMSITPCSYYALAAVRKLLMRPNGMSQNETNEEKEKKKRNDLQVLQGKQDIYV